MPPNEGTTAAAPSSLETANTPSHLTEEMAMQVMRVFGPQNQYEPTQAQVDKILALQEKGMDYTHEERMKISPKQKIEIGILIFGSIILCGVFVLCLLFAKEYLGQLVSGIVGLITGSFGGYGLGKSKTKKEE